MAVYKDLSLALFSDKENLVKYTSSTCIYELLPDVASSSSNEKPLKWSFLETIPPPVDVDVEFIEMPGYDVATPCTDWKNY